jgi:hypothetical protein
MTAITLLFSILITGGSMILTFLSCGQNPILIQSLESKTVDGHPVFNKITYIKKGQKDIWMMNQSHHGQMANEKKWDRLAIIVDKESRSTRFLQLPAGKLEWDDHLIQKEMNFKVSCFMCHANGPRAIRPNNLAFKLSLLTKTKIFLWNLRIKSYGPLKESSLHTLADKKLTIPFRFHAPLDNEKLNIKSCTRCHNGDNMWPYRNKLTRQNVIAIEFMLENKIMPPPGFHISEGDKKELKQFLRGF